MVWYGVVWYGVVWYGVWGWAAGVQSYHVRVHRKIRYQAKRIRYQGVRVSVLYMARPRAAVRVEILDILDKYKVHSLQNCIELYLQRGM